MSGTEIRPVVVDNERDREQPSGGDDKIRVPADDVVQKLFQDIILVI